MSLEIFEMKPCHKCPEPSCVEGSGKICPFDKPFVSAENMVVDKFNSTNEKIYTLIKAKEELARQYFKLKFPLIEVGNFFFYDGDIIQISEAEPKFNMVEGYAKSSYKNYFGNLLYKPVDQAEDYENQIEKEFSFYPQATFVVNRGFSTKKGLELTNYDGLEFICTLAKYQEMSLKYTLHKRPNKQGLLMVRDILKNENLKDL